MSTDVPSFESALDRLEEIVLRIEAGDLELDEALALFGEGIALLRHAGQTLDHAEARTQQLLEGVSGWELHPMDQPE